MWSPVKTSIHTRFLHSAFTRSSCWVVNGQPMKSFHYSVQLFRLTSMKKKCIASAVETWGNIADELTKSSSRFNSRPDYEQVWSSGIPALYLSRPSIILYFSVFYSHCRWYSDTVKSAIYQNNRLKNWIHSATPE